MASAGEGVVKGPPFVAIHFAEATAITVVGAERDYLRGIGGLVNVAEGFGNAVDG